MSDIIKYLRLLNRKEHFFLLRETLGKGTFCLSKQFRTKLRNCLNKGSRKKLSIPPGAFVAMDYHLNWIQMALYLAANKPPPRAHIKNDKLYYRNPEDIDLLVAFDDGPKTHLILIEAKAHTGWTNEQLKSKADRLKLIFNEDRHGRELVTPHFLLMSPKRSEEIETEKWPDWMTQGTKKPGNPLWLPLPLGESIQTKRYDPAGKNKKPKKYRYLRLEYEKASAESRD